jgi:hypothetical protein
MKLLIYFHIITQTVIFIVRLLYTSMQWRGMVIAWRPKLLLSNETALSIDRL